MDLLNKEALVEALLLQREALQKKTPLLKASSDDVIFQLIDAIALLREGRAERAIEYYERTTPVKDRGENLVYLSLLSINKK